MYQKGFLHATHETERDGCITGCTELRIHYIHSASDPRDAELDFVEVEHCRDGKMVWVRDDSGDWESWAELYLDRNLDDVAERATEAYLADLDARDEALDSRGRD